MTVYYSADQRWLITGHRSPLLFCLVLVADPFILPHVRIDRCVICFLLAGAHMMCPVWTSLGGWLPPANAALPTGTPVAFDAEG